MPQILINVSETMLAHIDSFQHHRKLQSRTEAMRELWLEAFKALGNPLEDEKARLPKGRAKKEPQSVGNEDTIEPISRIDYTSDYYKQLFLTPIDMNAHE